MDAIVLSGMKKNTMMKYNQKYKVDVLIVQNVRKMMYKSTHPEGSLRRSMKMTTILRRC